VTLHQKDYFASIGHPIPKHTNPAEFFLDLVNNDFTPDEEVRLRWALFHTHSLSLREWCRNV
jgi:hypothetical protein